MELPFAVDTRQQDINPSLQQSDSSLVTASSQGSFLNNSSHILDCDDTPLQPNTPHDVILPPYDGGAHSIAESVTQQQHQPPPQPATQTSDGHLVTPAQHSIVEGLGGGDQPEVIDFTYVNISESDAPGVDLCLEPGTTSFRSAPPRGGDVLLILLSDLHQNQNNEALLKQTEDANEAATKAATAKKSGDLISALEHHTLSATLYRESALVVKDRNPSLASSLLTLSQTQAKSALALKAIVKLNPVALERVFPSVSKTGAPIARFSTPELSHKDRLRAAVRGALGSRHPHEVDISESQFLGSVSSPGKSSPEEKSMEPTDNEDDGKDLIVAEKREGQKENPVDEMMELERELRDMDMTLELGNSISSLDARMQNRMRNSTIDGSFMVVPPGSSSYMASSAMWGSSIQAPSNRISPSTANKPGALVGGKARANRVQNILDASTANNNKQNQSHIAPGPPTKVNPGLESSWWGGAGAASQMLSSSVISMGSRPGHDGGHIPESHAGQPTNTKQLMRLMDSLKTLGDENAALLREVEEAEMARQEAKQTREQMKRFKVAYGQRFSSLTRALEKFRQEQIKGEVDPVSTSDYIRDASVTEKLQRQDQLIRKLTTDLKREKDESKKKDVALRKYESFYREVKARSAQKAAMKTQQQRQHKVPKSSSTKTTR